MKIIIAPNSFKGSLDAFRVAQAIETGLKRSKLEVECELFPIADGGDHTLEVFQGWRGGDIRTLTVMGPMGEEVMAEWGYIDQEKTAVIEMAKASGLSLIPESELDPNRANSYGTGQLIKEAVEQGAETILLGLGGSATVDGGLGILQALGAKILDEDGKEIGADINPVLKIHDLDSTSLDAALGSVQFVILCDVDNPLLGPDGAAAVFGPQKGASPEQVKALDKGLATFAQLIEQKTGKELSDMPGAGAAGGIAVALKAFFNVELVSGVDYLLEKMHFESSLVDAGLLITAEGKVDWQTLQGKGPFGVAIKARKKGIPAIIFAGKADDIDALNEGFDAVFSITNGPASLAEAMQSTEKDLEALASQVGNLLAAKL